MEKIKKKKLTKISKKVGDNFKINLRKFQKNLSKISYKKKNWRKFQKNLAKISKKKSAKISKKIGENFKKKIGENF